MSNNFDALSAMGDDLLAEGYPVSQVYTAMPTMLTMLTGLSTLTMLTMLTLTMLALTDCCLLAHPGCITTVNP